MFFNHSELCFADILFIVRCYSNIHFLNFGFNLEVFFVIRKYLSYFFKKFL